MIKSFSNTWIIYNINWESEKRSKKGLRRKGDGGSFIPLFREPSSIEKILGEAERDKHQILEHPKSTKSQSQISQPQKQPSSPRIDPPKATSTSNSVVLHKQPTSLNSHSACVKIQAAYRGYTARRSARALRGLVRLKGVVGSQSVKRQTANAMRYMQMVVRVQSQIRSRRAKGLRRQVESSLGAQWNQLSEAGNEEDWDDSLLTKEEIEIRLQKKAEAATKRERAISYASSHQLSTSAPKSSPMQNGHDLSRWNWLDHNETPIRPTIQTTPPRPKKGPKPSPSPTHSRSSLPPRMKSLQPSSPFDRTPQSPSISYTKARDTCSFKEDDSLTSCSTFAATKNYMASTVSAKAKAKVSNYGSPSPSEHERNRRQSYPLSNKVPSFKGSPVQSVGNMSVDSTVSMSVGLGRKPFNRFV